MEFKDYYRILGVDSTADETAIRAAYRKLARKYHPDKNKESDAEERFKEVNEAYEVLKDKEKRASYDQLRAGGYRGGDSFQPPPGWTQGGPGFDFGGGGDFSDFFESLFGRASGRQAGSYRTRSMRGQDISADIDIDLATAYAGGSTRLGLHDGAGSERVLDVKIPAGIESEKTIRLSGQGHPGAGGGPAGDLLLKVHIRPHARFRLEGRDIVTSLPVAPWEAALGAKVAVPTLGGMVDMQVPAGSQSGRKLRLKGRGLPGKPAGDQLVVLEIHVPPADDEHARKAYAAFRDAFKGYDPR